MARQLKPFKTYEEQCDLLISRGMIVENRARAIKALQDFNYYRLAGYWYSYLNKSGKTFKYPVKLDSILALYNYDAELRGTLRDELEHIETKLRALTAYELGKIDPIIYLDPHKLNHKALQINKEGETNYNAWLTKFKKLKSSSKERFIQHHIKVYGGKLPIWVAVEIMDWGSLSHLYMMSPKQAREEIANECGLTPPQLESWIKTLNIVRNYCSHSVRLYNRVLPIRPKYPEDKAWKYFQAGNNKIFTAIALIVFLESKLSIGNSEKLLTMLDKFPEKTNHLEAIMGTPANWRCVINQLINI